MTTATFESRFDEAFTRSTGDGGWNFVTLLELRGALPEYDHEAYRRGMDAPIIS